MLFAEPFTLSQSSPPVRKATHLRTLCFFRIYFAFREIFVNQHVLLQFDLHWDSPKLPWRKQRICGPFVLNTTLWIVYIPLERLFVLCHSLIRSTYFIQVYMFIRLIHSAPFLRFTFFFTHIFLIYFSNSWWCRWSAKTRNFIFIFHFSIVIRGEWLWKAANINDKDNSAAVYVVSTLKVHNPLFSVGKLLRNKLMQRFYWSIQSKW